MDLDAGCYGEWGVCCDRYIKMSSPNMNNVILAGAVLAFTSIIFGGTDGNMVDDTAHLVVCKVSLSPSQSHV